MRSFKIIHSVLGKSELRTVMTVRMRPIYYNSSLFDLILIFNKSGLYFTDQLQTQKSSKTGPDPPPGKSIPSRTSLTTPYDPHTAR